MSPLDFHYLKRYPRELPGVELDDLLSKGWFRLRQSMYTCSHVIDPSDYCLKRVSCIRYEVDGLGERGSHKRIRMRNRSFKIDYRPFKKASRLSESLYSRYRSTCGFLTSPSIDSLMTYPSRISVFDTMEIRILDGRRLIAVGLFDHGEDSVASILHFYDPDYRRHSLGKHLMLLTMDWMRLGRYRYYYPGYVVAGNPRFDYKLFLGRDRVRYLDMERLEWLPFRDELLIPEIYTKDDTERFESRMGIADEFAVLGLV